jgi:ABC-type cobalamin/Fe3+-siderophores transport system ATPase subunit
MNYQEHEDGFWSKLKENQRNYIMIEKLIIKNPKDMIVPWWHEVPQLKQFKEIEFKKGLNILFGPNGSGKSTIIRSLAIHFMCYTSGRPIINENSINEFFGGIFNENSKSGYEIIHDGQIVHYFSPILKLGFDSYGQTDFKQIGEAIETMESQKYSSGNKALHTMNRILTSLTNTDYIEDKLNGKVNDVWQKKIDIIHRLLKGSGKQKQRTLLLDEPDKNLDIPKQITFWNYIQEWAKQFQVIIASHNIFALKVKANFIELQQGYIEKCKNGLKS